ncbi:MAG: YrhB domain-containing protein [Ferruginibacter sp.]
MISFEEAKKIAETEINNQIIAGDSLVIVEEEIIEKEYAWIFPYTSKKLLETGDMHYAIGGNGPIFISKADGQISTYRTGLGIRGMIDEHEEKNKLWLLSLTNSVIDTSSLLALKKVLGWSQEQTAEFKKSKDKMLDTGSRTRLIQIQSLLDSNHIATDITQAKLIL